MALRTANGSHNIHHWNFTSGCPLDGSLTGARRGTTHYSRKMSEQRRHKRQYLNKDPTCLNGSHYHPAHGGTQALHHLSVSYSPNTHNGSKKYLRPVEYSKVGVLEEHLYPDRGQLFSEATFNEDRDESTTPKLKFKGPPLFNEEEQSL